MLVVRVELWPGGDPFRSREIARMNIANISNLADLSDYDCYTYEHTNALTKPPTPPQSKHIDIKRHSRRQSVWALIAKAAKKAAG